MAEQDTTVEFTRRCRHCGAGLSATTSFCSKCGASAAVPGGDDPLRARVCDLFGADLDIERELGRGGMAAVYAAYDPALQRRVAVKVLLPDVADDNGMADRFLKEARTVAALQHPHVVAIHSVRSRDGVHAIVMQMVDGRGLDAVLAERKTVPVHVAGMLLAQAAAGLQHAHDRGVIHRDVKPSNVLIDRDGRAVVSDFGIARREGTPRTTATGLVFGTWAYMSPEQRSADAVTAATDQYALGVMAFEVLAGRLPFEGTPAEMLRAHLHNPPPSVRDMRSDVPQSVDSVLKRMMAKAPAERFPSLREVERALRTLVPDEAQTTLQLAAYSHVRQASGSQVMAASRIAARGVRAAPARPASAAAPGLASEPVRESEPFARSPDPSAQSRGGRRLWPVIAGIAAGAVVLGVAWALMHRSDSAAAGAGGAVEPVPAPASAPVARDVTPPSGAETRRGSPGARGLPPAAGQSVQAGARVAPAPLASGGAAVIPGAAIAPPSPGDAAVPPSAARPARPLAEPELPAGPTAPAASREDARRVGREFVTMLNQRRYRELAQIPAMGGDQAARAHLARLVESAADFSAGFDRLPSAPEAWSTGFFTEFDLDLQYRDGSKLLRARLYMVPDGSGWRVAGLMVEPPG